VKKNNGKMSGHSMSIEAKCEACQEIFLIRKNDLRSKCFEVVSLHPAEIELLYYDCPVCRKRYFVQVKDDRTKELFNDLEEASTFLGCREPGKTEAKAKFDKTRKELSRYRDMLKAMHEGSLVRDNENDCSYELRFTK